MGTNSGESGVMNLEAENIRSRAESTGRCVKLKAVTEIRQAESRDPRRWEKRGTVAFTLQL